MPSCSCWAVVALACALVGCGDLAPQTGDSGMLVGASGSGGAPLVGAAGQANAGSGGSAGSAGSAGSSLGGSSSSPPAMACSSYTDKTGYQLSVRIENQMSRTLYLGQEDQQGCTIQRLFQVADGARNLLPSLDGCHTSCDQMMTSGPVMCPLACASPATIKLDPKQTLTLPWDGRFGVMQTLPQSCLPASQTGPAACVQAQRIEPAIFTFSARAGSSLSCLGGASGCAAACAPNAAGGCTNPASVIAGTIYTTEYVVKLEPGETSPSGEAPFIGLIFKDSAQ